MRLIKEAASLEEAVSLALKELNTTMDKVDVEILEEGSSGIFGFGKRLFKVAVTEKVEEEQVEEAEDDEENIYYGDDESFDGTNSVSLEEEAKSFVQKVLTHFRGTFQVKSESEEYDVTVSVTGSDCALLIGRGGETLEALQYLTSIIVNRKTEQKAFVHVDIGGYKRRHEHILVQNAKRMAHKVAASKRVFEMRPMRSYERRIIHEALQSFKGVKTYSEGEGASRRVIIAPVQDEK